MKSYLWILAIAFLLIPAVGAIGRPQAAGPAATPPPAQPPAALSWAFVTPSKKQPPETANANGLEHVPGSSKAYTAARISDLHDPPDWFPSEHPPMPKVVSDGAGPNVPACASCHLPSGLGHPESADLAGLPAAYIEQQMADFKSGARIDTEWMSSIGKAISASDVIAASKYFAALPPKPWVKVVETDRVPKFFVNTVDRMRLPWPGGGMEPLGERIIELPQDPALATKRDPHSGFVAYVPVGSIAKGENLVTTGNNGETLQCDLCHGQNLTGLNDVPRLAGLSPTYIARQLYFFQIGTRNGGSAALMKPVVQHLTDEDILNISAYLASLKP